MSHAVILFAHGARDPEWANPMRRVQAEIRQRLPGVTVELAFLEFMAPTLLECVNGLIAQGVGKIVVLPMFIAQGGHLKHDLPQIIDEMRAAHPQVQFEQADALGDADAIVHAIVAHLLALAGV